LSHRFACYNTYQTSDGRHLALGAVENRFWQGLCDHLGRPQFGPLQYDEIRREEIIDFLRQTFAAKTLAEWEEELADMDICTSGVRTMEEVLEHPLFVSRGMVHRYRDGEGRVSHGFGIPVKLSDTPGSIRTPPPSFGASSRHILGEIGYEESKIERFIAAGVV
jgi:crotonobetainyl-CoA:carnitine CoA-transferase CaiB-like acyl-CoA transferase